MALKITTQIGTNRGLTSEAYIRIFRYEVSKLGFMNCWLQVYQSEADANQPEGETPIYKESVSLEIGSTCKIPLVDTLTRTVKKQQLVEYQETIKVPIYVDAVQTGVEDKVFTRKKPMEVDVEETYEVPNLSLIEGQDIFEYGYTKLKEKLVTLYGAENIVDC
jgi:hypothetical protein